MALINCPECNGSISDKANYCLHCGCPQSEFVKSLSYTENLSISTQEEVTAQKTRKRLKVPSCMNDVVNEVKERNRKVFSENLRYFIKEKDIVQADLAKALNVSACTISDYTKGRTVPRMDKLQGLASYLGIEPSDLIEERSINNEQYRSKEAMRIAEELEADPELIVLHQSLLKLPQSDRTMVQTLLERLSESRE